MGHDEQGRLPLPGEVVVQPQHRVEVEVVRRLVEEEELGLDEQGPRERDAHAPPSAQDGRGAVL